MNIANPFKRGKSVDYERDLEYLESALATEDWQEQQRECFAEAAARPLNTYTHLETGDTYKAHNMYINDVGVAFQVWTETGSEIVAAITPHGIFIKGELELEEKKDG